MVEKPLTHSKRKVNPDLEKMKPELRQMEEQYVYRLRAVVLVLTWAVGSRCTTSPRIAGPPTTRTIRRSSRASTRTRTSRTRFYSLRQTRFFRQRHSLTGHPRVHPYPSWTVAIHKRWLRPALRSHADRYRDARHRPPDHLSLLNGHRGRLRSVLRALVSSNSIVSLCGA